MAARGASELSSLPDTGSGTWVEIGWLLRPTGREGRLLVELHGEDLKNLLEATEVRLEGGPGEIPFRIRHALAASPSRAGHARAHLELLGLGSREQAVEWKGARLSLREAAIQALPAGEFYWREIIGLRARLPDGSELGRVEEIWSTRASDVLVVCKGSHQNLVPALRELLVRVDLEAGEIWLDPPAGMIEDEA